MFIVYFVVVVLFVFCFVNAFEISFIVITSTCSPVGYLTHTVRNNKSNNRSIWFCVFQTITRKRNHPEHVVFCHRKALFLTFLCLDPAFQTGRKEGREMAERQLHRLRGPRGRVSDVRQWTQAWPGRRQQGDTGQSVPTDRGRPLRVGRGHLLGTGGGHLWRGGRNKWPR